MTELDGFDVVVVGGGPAGATAANDLARAGHAVLLLDRAGRIKPCGGAIPPAAIEAFEIPDELLVAHVTAARIVSPSAKVAHMPIKGGGFVGMVDRAQFDEWLRERAAASGARRVVGTYQDLTRTPDGRVVVRYKDAQGQEQTVRARVVIGADGAKSAVALQTVPHAAAMPYVFAFHEIVRTPAAAANDAATCDVYYGSEHSPDFYGWVFPHGSTTSIGLGSARKGFGQRRALAGLRRTAGLEHAVTLRREGAPIPMKPLRRWDDGRNVVLAGDAAGVVAPASGEGIFYAMLGGRLAADAAAEMCRTGKVAALRQARRRFMRDHGQVFRVLGLMQRFWYATDARRERFCSICRDPDVQELTWASYMTKKLVRTKPAAHMRIFFKNIAHLTGLVSA